METRVLTMEDDVNVGGEHFEQAALLAETERKVQRAYEAQKQFMSTVSHELRAPLTVIKGTLAMLLERGDAIDELNRRELLGSAFQQTERIIELTRRLLDLQRLDSGTAVLSFLPLDLVVTLDRICDGLSRGETVQGMRKAKGERLKIRFRGRVREAPCSADAQALRQVFEHLIDNAVHHAPGSPITVTVGPAARPERWRVEVSDHGPGIPEPMKELVFDRLVGQGTGAGLGLAIVRALVHLHGGEVGVGDRPSGGTVAWVELPQKNEKSL